MCIGYFNCILGILLLGQRQKLARNKKTLKRKSKIDVNKLSSSWKRGKFVLRCCLSPKSVILNGRNFGAATGVDMRYCPTIILGRLCLFTNGILV